MVVVLGVGVAVEGEVVLIASSSPNCMQRVLHGERESSLSSSQSRRPTFCYGIVWMREVY